VILVVDASAIVAIGLIEPEREAFLARMRDADEIFMTPINVTEAGLALVLRHNLLDLDRFASWIAGLRVREVEVPAAAVLHAYMVFGRGVHRARLNLGDCFAYALAKQLDAPLLYKGGDFPRTDIRPALQPT
jgi:ribonuclease VapC